MEPGTSAPVIRCPICEQPLAGHLRLYGTGTWVLFTPQEYIVGVCDKANSEERPHHPKHAA